MNARCFDHSGVCSKIEEVKNMVKVEKIDREKAVQDVWKGIDSMRYWVVAGMGSLIVAAFTVVLTKVL